MKNVRIISAIPKENKKLKVAAYCRVSTFGLTQLRGLELQIKTYTKMIKNCSTGFLQVYSLTLKADCAEAVEPIGQNA